MIQTVSLKKLKISLQFFWSLEYISFSTEQGQKLLTMIFCVVILPFCYIPGFILSFRICFCLFS